MILVIHAGSLEYFCYYCHPHMHKSCRSQDLEILVESMVPVKQLSLTTVVDIRECMLASLTILPHHAAACSY